LLLGESTFPQFVSSIKELISNDYHFLIRLMTLHVDSKETISTSALEVFMLLVKRSVNEVRSYLATEEAFSVLIPAVRSAGLEGTQKLYFL